MLKIGKILCRMEVHRPLKGHTLQFIDRVSGKSVYKAMCSCGKEWLVDSPFGFFGTKLLLGKKDEREC